MAVADDLARSARRAADDQPGPVQRRGAARGAAPARSPPPSSTTSAATSRCPTHDGTLEIGGAVEHPTTPDARRPARACRRTSAPSRWNARATGAWRCGRCRPANPGATTPSRPHAGPAPSCTTSWSGSQPAARRRSTSGSRAPTTAPYHLTPVLAGHRPGRPDLRPRAAARPRRRSGGGDPDRLRDERRAAAARPRSPVPAHRAPLVRRRLGEVAEADRRPHRAVHRRVPDRPLHVRVARPPARARHASCACAPASPTPLPASTISRGHLHGARQGLVGNRAGDAGRRQPHRRRRLAPGAARAARRALPVAGLVVRLGGRPTSAATPSAPGRPTPPATSNPRSRPGTGSATATTPSRSSTSTWADQEPRQRLLGRATRRRRESQRYLGVVEVSIAASYLATERTATTAPNGEVEWPVHNRV